MAKNINKVMYFGRKLLGIDTDTVSPGTLLKGITAHDAGGNPIVGTYEGAADVSGVDATAMDVLAPKVFYGANGKDTGRIPTYGMSDVRISGPNIQAPGGYYPAPISVSLPTVRQAPLEITRSDEGITVTAEQQAGYVNAGSVSQTIPLETVPLGDVSLSLDAESGTVSASLYQQPGYVAGGVAKNALNLPTQEGKTVMPSAAAQTAVGAGKFTTGNVLVAGDADLLPENIKAGVEIFGVTGTYEGGGSGGAGVISPEGCLTFAGDGVFSLSLSSKKKSWNGTMEWTDGDSPWAVWDGTTTLRSSANGRLYLRGTNNTSVTSATSFRGAIFLLSGANVACEGNIESLLDYQTVAGGGHPDTAIYAFAGMFMGVTALVKAPTLGMTVWGYGICQQMFQDCTALKEPAAVYAETIGEGACQSMYSGCSALSRLPVMVFPAASAYGAAEYMFFGTAVTLSTAKTSACPYPWGVPYNDLGGSGGAAMNMFGSCPNVPEDIRSNGITARQTYYTNLPPVS